MKHSLALIGLLVSFTFGVSALSAPAPALVVFAETFVARLVASDFDAAKFCKDFWLSSQVSTCLALPWAQTRTENPTLAKVIPTAKADASFVSLGLGTSRNLLLTATLESHQWRLSLDLREVWEVESAKWQKDSRPIEAHFAAPIEAKARQALEVQIKGDEAEIAKALGVSPMNVPFYFVNSPDAADSLGLPYPARISAGARDGFILVVGDPLAGAMSTIYHELVQSYTAFHGSFFGGKGTYPNAAMTEGLATVFELQKIWSDTVPKAQTAAVLCNDVQIAELASSGDLFRLFDDSYFHQLNGKGENPANLAAAALVQPLMNYFSLDEFKQTWNDIAKVKTAEERKAIVLSKISAEELHAFATDFYADLREQMRANAGLACR